MKFELWLAFVGTYTLISILPGPSVFMVVGQALGRGLRAAFLCILGDVLGGVVLIALSLFGVGAILATSALAFQVLKWAGVGYMAYLGYRQIKDAKSDYRDPPRLGSIKAGFLTGVLNPKAIMFYMAFLSQFMDPSVNLVTQYLVLVVTSIFVVGVVLSGYALAAARARRAFESPAARRRFGYTGGGLLLGGSLFMAAR